MNQKQVEIYSKDGCPHCRRAKALLDKKGVEHTEYNISKEPDRMQEMLDRSNNARTVPQIFIGGEHIPGGADGLFERDAAGELDKLLGLA